MLHHMKAPVFREHIAGIDWGYINPGALAEIGITLDERFILQRETKESERDPEWWEDRFAEAARDRGVRWFYPDPSRPEFIDRLKRRVRPYGAQVIPADNDVFPGIMFLCMLMKVDPATGLPKFQVKAGCKHFPHESSSYRWRELASTLNLLEEPEPYQDDHIIDATRYGCYTHAITRKTQFRTIRFDLLRR